MQISIPNSATGIDTNKLINDLIEAERQPIIRTETRIDNSENMITLWRTLSSNLKLFQDNAKKLYGFNNPFNERKITISHPALVDAQTIRNAKTGTFPITIKKIATSDRWLSKEITNNYIPPQGDYVIAVGSQIISFDFSGNTINEFIETINLNGKELLKASLIKKNTKNKNQVMLLEALKSGQEGKIILKKNAVLFAKEIKIIGPRQDTRQNIYLGTNYITDYLSNPELFYDTVISPDIHRAKNEYTNQHLVLLPGAIGKIQVPTTLYKELLSKPDATINIEMFITPHREKGETSHSVQKTDSNVLSVELEKALVHGESLHSFNSYSQKNTLESTSTNNKKNPDLNKLKSFPVIFDNTSQSLYKVTQKDIRINQAITMKLVASTLIENDTIQFIITNPFPKYQITINQITISDNSTDTDYAPLQVISEAHNAVVEFNGIDIERETNNISDILPGITLILKRADEKQTIDITIISDKETIKNDIIAYVGSYNQVIKNLVVYTRKDPTILDIIGFQNEAERSKATENLGKLSGEFSLTRLLNNLQTITSAQYHNSINSDVTSLRSIGIAPNLENNTNALTLNKFLDINEETLDNSITTNTAAISMLFGSDNNNDIIIDYGIAFSASESVKLYIGLNGIINQNQNTLKNKITDDKKQLTRYNERLVEYKQELRRKFGSMEQIVNQLNKSSSSINNLSTINKQNQ